MNSTVENNQEKITLLNKYNQLKEIYEKYESTNKKIRNNLNNTMLEYNKLEKQINDLDTIGFLVGTILKRINKENFIINISQEPSYLVTYRKNISEEYLVPNTRIVVDIKTLTIMRPLPMEIDLRIQDMLYEITSDISYNDIGGLDEQLKELREAIELPLINKEIFQKVGIKPIKGVLLYGQPGTGKTLLAKIISKNINSKFLSIGASSIIDKYTGESAKLIRDIFTYAKNNSPCIIFIDEIDSIGSKRLNGGTAADREIQRTLLELLNQLDGFNLLTDVKVIMATNRPDVLDPALLRPGRLDKKIEIPLPDEKGRLSILKIYIRKINIKEELDISHIIQMTSGFNGADIKNLCTEAGYYALRDDRDYCQNEDFIKACRKLISMKQLESKITYQKI